MLQLETALLKDIEAGTLVVPSTQRAAALQLAYSNAQLELGRRLWRSPDVCSYPGWLERAAARFGEEGAPLARTLHPAEEWLHWRDIVRTTADTVGVLFDNSLAGSLHRSAHTLHDWRIPQSALHRAGTGESELLARVLRRFESRCEELHSIAPFRLSELLQSWQPKWPVAFAGFIEPTPAQRVSMQSGNVRGSIHLRRRGETFIADAADPVDEIALAAEWCRTHLSADPRSRLLVVLPDLAQRRSAALRAFEQVLSPQSILETAGKDASSIVAVEGGRPLADFPLVQHALTTLRLLVGPLDFPTFSAWLRAPFWGTPNDVERSRLDLWLRARLRPQVDVKHVREELSTVPSGLTAAATQLRTMLASVLATLEQPPAGAMQWAHRFVVTLAALAWPGSRSLNSAEHQTRIRFMELLDEFAALGPGAGRFSASEAVAILCRLAVRIAFEPATGDAAITLTDALSDPIVGYDGIWVAGLQADTWPSPVYFDPFIPLSAQRAAGIPACSPSGGLQQARKLLQVWQTSTAQLVMSWVHHSEDGEHLASPLIHEMEGVQPWRTALRLPSLAHAARGIVELESYEDANGAPWLPTVTLPSGTRSLEYQNLCPFRAYAELRLGCVPLESPRPGVDFRSRGQLLHRALEYLWIRFGDSKALETHRGDARDTLIGECVARAARDCFDAVTQREQPRAVTRECRRAARLIAQLCELEEQRQPFRVQAIEARRQLNIAGAALDVRLDRIDELADGTLAIFDYKSGKPKPQDWLAARPSNLQLLVYLRAAKAPVTALAAIHLTASRISYRGVADRDERLPNVAGLEDSWPQELARWHSHVDALAKDFLAGRAVLDPLGDACRTCHIHAFCRIADAESIVAGMPQDD